MEKMKLTDDDKLSRHKYAEDVEDNLEDGPFLGLEEPPGTGTEDECVPCGDGQGANEEVFVSGQVDGEVERGREESGDVWGAHGRRVAGWMGGWVAGLLAAGELASWL
jgi:hypothetical protein